SARRSSRSSSTAAPPIRSAWSSRPISCCAPTGRSTSGTRLAPRLPMFRKGDTMNTKMVKELLLQSLEHEMGGVKVYETALKCVVNEDLKEEWEKYLEETEKHVQVLHDACLQLNLDPEEQTPGRKITHDIGASLIAAMETA